MKNIIKSTLFAILLTGTTQSLIAQTIVVPDTLAGWHKTWTLTLNGSQATYDNWSEGGVNTISATGGTVYTLMYRKDRFAYGFRTNLRYGQSKLGNDDIRKSDDLISIRNRVTYQMPQESSFSAYGAIHFRSQFADGFDYGAKMNPAGGDSLLSSFFAPAYLTEGIGMEYKANDHFAADAGLALKQTFLSDGDLAPNYGMNLGDTFRSEGGFTTGITYQNTLMEDISYSTSLETFTNFKLPLSETDVFWANEITGQINSIISASFQFEIRYDNDFSSEAQIKQVLSAGLSVNLH